MERPVSRRRHRAMGKEEQQGGELTAPMAVKPSERSSVKKALRNSGSIWGFLVTLLILICAAVTVLAKGAQVPLLAANGHNGYSDTDVDAPTRLQDLHPEDHIHRAPKTIELNWTVTFGMRRPDGVLKRVYLINDLFPGPTVEARSGDRLLITVHNALENETTTMHWHGLHMRGANDMDGVDSVTQCPIAPGDFFVYDFEIADYQSGTFWYHSHSSLQRGEGLFGALIVHTPVPLTIRGSKPQRAMLPESERYGYDREALMLMGDWYHDPAQKTMDWYLSVASWGNEPVPDSLLINGAGHFPCSRVAPAKQLDCSDDGYVLPHLKLESSLIYRIRAINFGTLAGISLVFQNHDVDVITVDGGIQVMRDTKEAQSLGILYSGQRVDFILRPRNPAIQQSGFTINLDREDFRYANPAMISEQAYTILPPASSAPLAGLTTFPSLTDIPTSAHIDLSTLISAPEITHGIPQLANETYMVYVNVMKKSINAFKPYSYLNHTSWKPQASPRVPLLGLPREEWDKNQLSIVVDDSQGQQEGKGGERWVDLVVNNLNEGSHPFHMHGHNFHVLSTHQSELKFGSYNPFEPIPPHAEFAGPPYDTSASIARDTVLIPFHGHVVLRFKADNPGLWFFHCHVMWHLSGGMAMTIDERTDDKSRTKKWNECKVN